MWTFIKKTTKGPEALELEILRALKNPVTIISPKTLTTPIVFSVPHSGRYYPTPLRKLCQIPLSALRLIEDAFVDEFIIPFARDTAPVIQARFPRCYVDVNRGPTEYPLALAAHLPPGTPLSNRAKLGMGVTPTRIGNFGDIYAHILSLNAVEARMRALYDPYHTALANTLTQVRQQLGHVLVFDCHSMPGSAPGNNRPDIVLGTRYGSSTHPDTVNLVKDAFAHQGFSVVCDYPYAGGYITEEYGRPQSGVEVIQIEINKDLYLQAALMKRSDRFADTRQRIHAALASILTRIANDLPIAAQ